MKTPKGILAELNELRTSKETLQPRAVLDRLIDLTTVVDAIYENMSRPATDKEVGDIFES